MTRALDGLERALDRLRGAGEVEVFIRSTCRLRVELTDDRARVAHGVENGTAVRVRTADGTIRFGASSGSGPEAAEVAAAIARSLPGDASNGWGSGGPWMDLGGPFELPPAAEAEAWLRRGTSLGGRAHLDAAVTVEVLGSAQGMRACRERGTVWGRLLRGAAVRSAVADRLDRLDPDDWEEPALAGTALPASLPAGGPVALLPGAVGGLAPALVAAVHAGGHEAVSVGPGWVCEDEGGVFDDTGFPSGRLVLADGKTLLAAPRGPGRRRRASFRSPPVERPAHLCFRPTGGWNGAGLLARSARPLLAGDGRWWTVLEAAPAREGRPLGPWTPWVVAAEPGRWVASCRAGVGRPRRRPEGVTAPTLVFEGLPPAVPVRC